jgi:transmembrane sensor
MTDVDCTADIEEALRREAWNWVLHVTSGHATRADIASLERWCAQSPRHTEAYARASGRWRAFGPAIEAALRQNSFVPAVAAVRPERVVGRRALLGGALVASAAGVAVMMARPPLDLWPSFSEFAADYRTATGERRRIQLAGRVSVEMNTRTSLNVRRAAGDSERIELIAGEAAVTTDSRPVEVIAAQGRILAEDAQLNVRCDGLAAAVTCLEGVVRIEYEGRSAAVPPQHQVFYSDRDMRVATAIDLPTVVGWRNGDIFFQNEPLSHVIEEVNRYRPGKIILMNEDLRQRRFTARFKLDRLDVIVPQLQATFNARVTTLPGGIVLVS